MKKVKAVLCLVLVVALAFTLAIPSLAAGDFGISPLSSDDIPFRFNFAALTGMLQDDLDPSHMGYKDTDSCVYLNVQQFPGNFYVYTNAYINGKTYDCTQRSALVTRAGKWLIYNLIYETYGRVKVSLGGARIQGGTASGVWSPDYTYYPSEGYVEPINP